MILPSQGAHLVLDRSFLLGDTAISPAALADASELLAASKSIPALNQVLIMDTCHAGGLTSSMLGLYDARMAFSSHAPTSAIKTERVS